MDCLENIKTATFSLDLELKILIVPKSELKNIKEIISKIIANSDLTAIDLAEFEMRITN